MGVLILEKLLNDTNNVTTDPCVTVSVATMFSLRGDGTATIYFDGTLFATLTHSNRTVGVYAAGTYCVTLNGQCPAASVYADVILGTTVFDGGEVVIPQDELPYAETITLAAINDTITAPANDWRSYGMYVKSGSVEVSTDGGATFPTVYDDTDLPVMWGQGNSDDLDITPIVIRALTAVTVVQVIGDYVVPA